MLQLSLVTILEVVTDDHIHQPPHEVVITTATPLIHIETNDVATTIASPVIDPILHEKDTVHPGCIAKDHQEDLEMVELREIQRLFLSKRA